MRDQEHSYTGPIFKGVLQYTSSPTVENMHQDDTYNF